MDASSERWLPVVGWEGFYEVSNHGRVRSVDRVIRLRNGKSQTFRGKIRRPCRTSQSGHWGLSLLRPGERFSVRIHVLVLEAFRGPRPAGLIACHNDGNVDNNCLSNLRWDTHQANTFDAIRHGRKAGRCGPDSQYCMRGHDLSVRPYFTNRGYRECIECRRESNRRSARRKQSCT